MTYHRVEHRGGHGVGVLATDYRCEAHHAALAPFEAHLRLVGSPAGVLVLVDEATGAVVARRHLRHLGPRRR